MNLFAGQGWRCRHREWTWTWGKGRVGQTERVALTCICSVSSVAQSFLTLCDPMDCSTPVFPVHHQLPEPTQTRVHCIGDAIQPSHPLSSPSPPALNLSQHQGLFRWSVLHIRWPKYWSFSFNISPSNEYSGLISFRIDWLDLYATMCKIMLDICATMCKIASGKLLCSTGSSAQCSVKTGGVGWKSGKEAQKGPDDCILTADSCCCTVETSTTL